MSIIASAPVPAGSRLCDAPTVDLMAVRRPRSAAFLTELGRRVDHLFAAGRGDQLAEHARALGSTEAEALAAWDAYRRSMTAPAAGRFPVNSPYRAAAPDSPARQAREAFESRSVETVAELAAKLCVTIGEVYDLALDHIAAEQGWTGGVGRRPVDVEGGNPELCPAWCAGGCGDTAERSHVRPIIETTARHGDIASERVEIRAQLQAYESPDLPAGIEPTEVWLQVMNADDNDGTSAALTPDEAEKLGQALLDAARTARTGR